MQSDICCKGFLRLNFTGLMGSIPKLNFDRKIGHKTAVLNADNLINYAGCFKE
jgi:hypothetical protein